MWDLLSVVNATGPVPPLSAAFRSLEPGAGVRSSMAGGVRLTLPGRREAFPIQTTRTPLRHTPDTSGTPGR